MQSISIEKRKTPSGVIKPCLGFACPFLPQESNTRILYKGRQIPFKPYTINLSVLDYGKPKNGDQDYYWYGIAKRFRFTHLFGWWNLKNWKVELKN